MKRIILYLFLLFTMALMEIKGQATYQHVSNTRIYDFLDELANDRHITLNSAIKPYTRTYIYNRLSEASAHKDSLNQAQQQELEHYLDYYTFGSRQNYLPAKASGNLFKKSTRSATSLNHLAYFYSDSLFNFSMRPILGLEYFTNSSGTLYPHLWRTGGLRIGRKACEPVCRPARQYRKSDTG